MSESHETDPAEVEPDTEPELQEDAADADSPDVSADGPGVGGYGGRDPKTDMPRVPSAPETQDDPKSHDAAPPADGKERWAGE